MTQEIIDTTSGKISGWNSDAMITHYTAAMELESEAIEEFKRIDPFGGHWRKAEGRHGRVY